MKKRKDFGRYCNFDTVEAPRSRHAPYLRHVWNIDICVYYMLLLSLIITIVIIAIGMFYYYGILCI